MMGCGFFFSFFSFLSWILPKKQTLCLRAALLCAALPQPRLPQSCGALKDGNLPFQGRLSKPQKKFDFPLGCHKRALISHWAVTPSTSLSFTCCPGRYVPHEWPQRSPSGAASNKMEANPPSPALRLRAGSEGEISQGLITPWHSLFTSQALAGVCNMEKLAEGRGQGMGSAENSGLQQKMAGNVDRHFTGRCPPSFSSMSLLLLTAPYPS